MATSFCRTTNRGRSIQKIANDSRNLNNKDRLRHEYIRILKIEEEKKLEQEANEADVIAVESIEWYARSNAEEHNTAAFDLITAPDRPLILRRGQPFHICVHFEREYNLTHDNIVLEFTIGSRPKRTKGTLIQLPVTDSKSFTVPIEDWDIRIHRKEPKAIHFQIQISCKAAVGVWNLSVVTNNRNNTEELNRYFSTSTFIYILFNPWCKEDAVYMENERNVNEYVLNECGKLYQGTATEPHSRRWIYGQFSSVALPTAMAILDISPLDVIGRGSPVRVVRTLSSMLNCENGNGVLEGRWSIPYDDGTAPFSWTGSVAILEKYILTNYEPVKYGQCWVYAGVFTSVCRALGIPCRPVTNYASAHDTDDTLTIDWHWSKDGKKLEDNDSIWNYHVWNECWMTRPDLPPGYGGWQAVDATPQETSEGLYQSGPVSVNAVRKGEVGFLYDTPFVFSEVNADVMLWKEDNTQKIGWRKLETKSSLIGQRILTKKAGVEDYVGERDLEDITEQYKYREGSPEERLAVMYAASHGNYAALFDIPLPDNEDVYFEITESEKVMIGQPFSVAIHVENKSDELRNVVATLTADSVFYTGIKAYTIKHMGHKFTLKPKQKEMLTMRVIANEYYDKLVDYSLIKLYAVATVEQTNQTWAHENDIALNKPRLQIEVKPPVKLGKKFDFTVSLKNPLSRTLRNCTFSIEGPGLSKPGCIDFRDVGPEESVSLEFWLIPSKAGKRHFLVVFNSQQLIDVQGSMEIEVT